MVSTEEIDHRIAELHNLGKGTRTISADIHKNFSYVGTRLRILFPEEYAKPMLSHEPQISKETRALKLFSERKSPTQVAIDLGLNTDDTEKFYKNFWRLERQYELYRIYNENKPRLRLFMYFYNQLIKRSIATRKDFDGILEIVDANIGLDKELEDINTSLPEFLTNHISTPENYGPIQ